MAVLAEMIDDENIALTPSDLPVAVGILAAGAGEVVSGHGASWTDP
jgi:hypothetical protein